MTIKVKSIKNLEVLFYSMFLDFCTNNAFEASQALAICCPGKNSM